jgi:signal transduction histidine kinase
VTVPDRYAILGAVPDADRRATTLKAWLPDLVLGSAVAAFGIVDVSYQLSATSYVTTAQWLVTLGCAVSATLFRHLPGGSLLAFWLTCLVLVLSSTPLLAAMLVVVLVGYGTGRHGSRLVVWLSGVSIPLGAALAALVVRRDGYQVVARIYDPILSVYDGGRIGTFTLLAIGLVVFAMPWLLGLLVRSLAQTEESKEQRVAAEALQREAEAGLAQARQIADLRASQARLANDVHDVVGHSLAVILAQAESAQFLRDDQTDQIRETLQNVASSARQSLQDVRAVLSSAQSDVPAGSATAGLDSLVDGLARAGHDVRSEVLGAPRPLPPEIEAVAFRVLQEMLTNALRHGRRGFPVLVERHWEDQLRIEVRNAVEAVDATLEIAPGSDGGLGIDGMRRRLESVGGRLSTRRRADLEGTSFTATAWIPTRAAA